MSALEAGIDGSEVRRKHVARPARVHILAPRRMEFGCGVCDHNEIVMQGLRDVGVLVNTTHFSEAGVRSPEDVRPGDVVFLQLSIYGFEKRGAPYWLPALLTDLKRAGARLVTFFHELWVRWPHVSSSAFWLAPLQWVICRKVLELSDTAIFNVEWGYEWARHTGHHDVRYIRTFSNVGEPRTVPNWHSRSNNVVVFGGAGARADIYRALVTLYPTLHGPLPLGLIDIGQDAPAVESYLGDRGPIAPMFCALQRRGPLPSDSISRLLTDNKFGLFAAPWEHAGKSGVLAAYAAHGICPVSIFGKAHTGARAALPPKPSVHYALLPSIDLRFARASPVFAAIAQTAYQHYHSSHQIVSLLSSALGTLQRVGAVAT